MNLNDLNNYFESLSNGELEALENEGAFMHFPPIKAGYDADPNGYIAFMNTGGDGVHFNIPEDMSDGKIIMTVPMNFGNENFTVGESLYEFLSLGSDFGYFSLEQLVYDFSATVSNIQNASSNSNALKKLKNHFNLNPWTDVEGRLRELNNLL